MKHDFADHLMSGPMPMPKRMPRKMAEGGYVSEMGEGTEDDSHDVTDGGLHAAMEDFMDAHAAKDVERMKQAFRTAHAACRLEHELADDDDEKPHVTVEVHHPAE
jgi:hypothetical protein